MTAQTKTDIDALAQKMFEKGQQCLIDGNLDEAWKIFNSLLNRRFDDPALLYLVADVAIRRQENGLAMNLLSVALHMRQDFQPAWNNLGVAMRHENMYAEARQAWNKALELGETVEALSNMSTLSADMGDPEDAIHWCDRAIAIDPEHWQSYWNKALAELTLRHWTPGWDLYEYRRRLDRYDSRNKIEAPYWDGAATEHLYLHGEQGVGDEVMFASIIPDLMARFPDMQLTVEAHKKFAGLLQQSFPGIAVVTEESEATGTYTAKAGMGSLGQYFRRNAEDFPGTPYLTPDPELVQHYRDELLQLGPAPHIAVTWVGGMKNTRVEDRSIPLALFRPILNKYTCVSGQYQLHVAEEIERERQQQQLPIIDGKSSGGSMHHQAALFAACDAVVTVCQTAVHVAGSIGTPVFCLTPSRPSWRYGISGDNLPWYRSVKQFRQKEGETWLQVISRVEQALRGHLRRKEAA